MAIHKNENKIVAARKGSPLIIGLGDNETFIASDPSALLAHTKKVIYLADEEMAIISQDKYIIKNLKGEPVDKNIEEIKWTVAQMEKRDLSILCSKKF